MITRIWHGRTGVDKSNQYLEFLTTEGTKEYRQTKGNLSVKVWNRKENDCSHFFTVTEWRDVESVKEFAGEDYEKAKYYPQDNGVLLEFEEKVNHYECNDVSNTKIRNYCNQFVQLYSGVNWFGESFTDKLEDVDEELVFKQPLPGLHCVGEIIWHCLYWRTVLINRLLGNHTYRKQTVEELNFLSLDKLKEKTWIKLKQEFAKSQIQILELLGLRLDSFLEEQYEPGYTYDYLVQGIIQHDIYHLGQIGFVKGMIGKNATLT